MFDKVQQKIIEETVDEILPLVKHYGFDYYKDRIAMGEDFQKNVENLIKTVGGKSFIDKCHEGFKIAQDKVVSKILSIEEQEKKLRTSLKRTKEGDSRRQMEKDLWFLEYHKAILKELMNVVAWTMFRTQRTHIRSLHVEGMGSGYLADSNFKSVKLDADRYNKDKSKFALITDITSCIGKGDLIVSDTRKGGLSFVEVKTGLVNKRILEILDKDLREEGTIKKEVIDLHQDHGKHGVKQLLRVLRQEMRIQRSIEYFEKDKEIDEKTKYPKFAQDLSMSQSSFGDSVNQSIQELYKSSKDGTLVWLDCCLVGLLRGKHSSAWVRQADFKHMVYHSLFKEDCVYVDTGADPNELQKYLTLPVHSLAQSIGVTTHTPLFLIGLEDKYVKDMLSGKLSIFVYFDPMRFYEICGEIGLNPQWVEGKEFRREKSGKLGKQLFDFGGKFLRINSNEASVIITISNIYSLVYELQPGHNLLHMIKEVMEFDRTHDPLLEDAVKKSPKE